MFDDPYKGTRPHHYKIIKSNDLELLEDEINLHLANGYILAGGICVDKYLNYCQAIYIDPKKFV